MRKKRFDSKRKLRHKTTREEDAAHRLTHLWAASHLLSASAPSLSRFYVGTSRQICQRINLKADSVTIKRMMCKRCNSLLIPGLGPTPPRVRHRSTREKHVVVSCTHCGCLRRFLSRAPVKSARKARKGKPPRGDHSEHAAGMLDTQTRDSKTATEARACDLQ